MTTSPNNIIKFPGEAVADVEAAAAYWLARTTSGAITLGELAEFEYWRAASPDHNRIYGEMEAMWGGLGAINASRTHDPPPPVGLERRPLGRGINRWGGTRRGLRLGQAAAAAAAVMIGLQYTTMWAYDYHTAPGEIRDVALADGSHVFLKGETALDAHVSGTGARTITLARGEAFFEVKHDAARPFVVDVGSGIVRDIGTGFSIARDGQSATVSVEHGAVGVTAGGSSDVLTSGQRVSFSLYQMSRKTAVSLEAIAAWRRGLYIAEGKPLGEVLSDLDEYYPGRIVVSSSALRASRINAVVQLDHINAWLDALNETRGVVVRRLGPLTIVSDRPT